MAQDQKTIFEFSPVTTDIGQHPHAKLDAARKEISSPAAAHGPGRVKQADDLHSETLKIAQTSHDIEALAKQAGNHKDEINAKRAELGSLLQKAVKDSDSLPADKIKSRLAVVESGIAAKGGQSLTQAQRDQLLQSDPATVPADKHDLYNLLQEQNVLKAAQIAPSQMRMLYAREAQAGHTDASAPLPDHGPITFTPSAHEVDLARKYTGEANRLSQEARLTPEAMVVSGKASGSFGQLLSQSTADDNSRHAQTADSELRQANALAAKDASKADAHYRTANTEADQINYSQIKKELADKSTSEDRKRELQRTLSASQEARLDYANFLVQQGKPNDAQVFLTKAKTESPDVVQTQSFQKINSAANAPSADQALIQQEKNLTLKLGTEFNDPKTAAQIVPKVLSTLTQQATDMTAAAQDVQKELLAANNKLNSGGLSTTESAAVKDEITALQAQQTSLAANLNQRKQELANTQYKAAILALASQDTKTAAAMLTAAKENDPKLIDYVKSQGGSDKTLDDLMDKTKEKSFWQKNWHWITEAGIFVGGALAVGAAVAFAPVVVVGLAVAGTIAAGSAAMYYAKKSAGEHATWKDAVEGGFDGALASAGGLGKLVGVAASSIPLIGRAITAVTEFAPEVVAKIAEYTPEALKQAPKVLDYGKTALTGITEAGSRLGRPLYEAGSALYSKAPEGVQATVDFLGRHVVPGRTSWAVGATYGSYKFHHDVANGDSVGHAALMFVPHTLEGAFATHAFSKSTSLLADAVAPSSARTGQFISDFSRMPSRLIPTTKLAAGIGVTWGAFKAGYAINNGATVGQALFSAPFDVLEGSQMGQFGSSFGTGSLMREMATTASKTTALGYGYSAVKHGTLYGIGQENARQATGNFLMQGTMNNFNLNFYETALKDGMQKAEGQLAKTGVEATAPSAANMSRYAWVGPKAVVKSAGLFTAMDGAGTLYNTEGPRISIPNSYIDIRPNDNPNYPLDPNRPNDLNLIKENMSRYYFPDLDTPRFDGMLPQDQ